MALSGSSCLRARDRPSSLRSDLMIVGDFAKYRNTGTVGKVVDIMEEEEVSWALLDTTDLLYDVATLDPASEEEYNEATRRDQGKRDQLEDFDRFQQDMEDAAEKFARISPSGAG